MPDIDDRSPERLLLHFEVERELADRLRHAPPERRLGLYREVYDELFARVPDHPQLTRRADPAERSRRIGRELSWLQPHLRRDMTYLELGPGDCAVAVEVARRVRRVYAVDVSEEITRRDDLPPNFRLVLSDGVSIDVPAGGVDLAYSNQLIEHLHPDDVRAQLANLLRALAPGGRYLCVTPHAMSGPHDISGLYGDTPLGFHLVEYTWTSLRAELRAAGFREVTALVGLRGRVFRVPAPVCAGVERAISALPRGMRRRVGARLPLIRMLARA